MRTWKLEITVTDEGIDGSFFDKNEIEAEIISNDLPSGVEVKVDSIVEIE